MAKSIIQNNRERCYICGKRGTSIDPLDCHHVFFGPYRSKSEKYGLKVYIHHNSCHIFGNRAVHVNNTICRELQEEVQKIAMEHYGWSVDDFRALFGKNYLSMSNADKCVCCGEIVPEGRQVCPACENGGAGWKER